MQTFVIGPGAVGGPIAMALVEAGWAPTVVARGAHLQAIRRHGLTIRTPTTTQCVRPAVRSLETPLGLVSGDLVLLAVKSQDTAAVLDALERECARITVVCVQNGIDNEALAADRFRTVLGGMAWIAGVHLEPGLVEVHSEAPRGALRLGPWPRGANPGADALASALSAHGFDAETVVDIAALKRGKLLTNLGNVLDAYAAPDERLGDLWQSAAGEALAVFAAAGVPVVPADQLLADMNGRVRIQPIDGRRREGGSTYQSLRRDGATETPYLNGTICRLGAEHGVPTPINAALLTLDERRPPLRSVAFEAILSG